MFREQLKLLRKNNHITQEKLAEIIGVERSTVGKWEGKDEIIPSPEVLDKIATFFGCSVDYLLGRTDQQKNAPETQEREKPIILMPSGRMQGQYIIDDRQRKMSDIAVEMQNLTDDDLDTLWRLVKSLSKSDDTE